MFNYILGFTGKQKLQTCLNISEELQFWAYKLIIK